ncbi:MAG: hypothetical protein KBA75_10850 [Alphaproteobacteria bacterium]|nr:hypothetical protein [Alphaproteobacteria bacterium]
MTPQITTATSTAPSPAEELQLLRLMGDLVTLLEREIIVVEERLTEELPDLVSRKQRLLVDYQAELKAATQQPEWLAKLPVPQKSRLRQLGETLQDVSARNARVLKAAATATQRLLHGIMTSVREERCTRPGYDHLVNPVSGQTQTQSVIFKTTA